MVISMKINTEFRKEKISIQSCQHAWSWTDKQELEKLASGIKCDEDQANSHFHKLKPLSTALWQGPRSGIQLADNQLAANNI